MKKHFYGIVASGIVLLCSCSTQKILYVKDMIPDSLYAVNPAKLVKIGQNDRFNIIVGSKNPELAAPFNNFTGSSRGDENASASSGPSSANEYIVDNDGNINFPILGSIHAEGQTVGGLSELIKNMLITKKLMSDPLVKVNLLNFKITFLGEIGGGGVLNVPDNKITLLDAIARQGGLSQNAIPNKVYVIREENGVRRMYVNDVTSTSVFTSPTYYLQQNDIVYAPPRTGRTDPREDRFWRYFGLSTSVMTMVLTIMVLIKK